MNDQTSSEFYDRFTGKLIADYVYGNPRAQAAIQHALRWIPTNSKAILDVGCGIGWSSSEIKKNFPNACLLALDLSGSLIKTAKKLFPDQEIQFVYQDFVDWTPAKKDSFDAIILLDVYEHIEKSYRQEINQKLGSLLSEDGVLIITFPSVSHQEYLRNYCHQGLQPVDEDVTEQDVSRLAEDLGAKVMHFGYVDIWRPKDYAHAVLSRKEIASNATAIKSNVETLDQKKERVRNHLKCRIMPQGVMLPIAGEQAICIVAPRADIYSETFIRGHAERLPTTVRFLHGEPYDFLSDDGTPLFDPGNKMKRIFRRLIRSGLHLSENYFKERAFVHFLKESKIKGVLAEYGFTGNSILEMCLKANIPIVVHFHGIDAHARFVLDEYASQYVQMFQQCAAIVAVSKDMVKQLISLGAPKEKLHLNPYGVDLSLFSGSKPEHAPPLFVAVGRFVDKKAPYFTLLAFQKVFKSMPDAQLIMVGDGHLLEACKQLSVALGIAERVKFPGPLSPAQISQLFQRARAFVQHSIRPSDGDSEGTPVAILEAGASGLPVVSSKHAGIKEAVCHEETGYLVEEGNVEMMADYMLKIAREPLLASKLGAAAREHIAANYSIEKSIHGLWTIIQKVIS